MFNLYKLGISSCICCLVIFILFISQGNALLRRDMKKARDLMDSGIYSRAIGILEKAVIENPTHAEAHFLLGVSYINNGNLNDAEEVFKSAVSLDPDYGNSIGKEYKKAADRSYIQGNVRTACHFFEKASEYNADIGKKAGYSLYSVSGDKTGNAEYFKTCGFRSRSSRKNISQTKNSSPDNSALRKINGGAADYEEKINGLLTTKTENKGHEGVYSKIVYERTYTLDDAYDKTYGQIKTVIFNKVDIRIGDQIEVIAGLMDGRAFRGKEIGIWDGDKEDIKWKTTRNGYYREKVKKIPQGSFTISLAKRRDIIVIVRVSRIIPSQHNVAFIGK